MAGKPKPVKKLTPEQKQMVEDNIDLAQKMAVWFSRRFPTDKEEYLSICYLALSRAASAFVPNKGDFRRYASTCMFGEMRNAVYPSKLELKTEYLEDLIPDSGWQEKLGISEFEDELVYKILQEQLLTQIGNKFKKKSKDIFYAHYANPDATQCELGKITGCSHQNVRQVKDRLKRLSKELVKDKL